MLYQDLLFHRDLGQGWRRARQLLKSEWWSARRLPASAESLLEQYCRAGSPGGFPLEYRPSRTQDLEQMLGDWDQVRSLPRPELILTLQKTVELTRQAAQILRQAGLGA